MNGRWKNTVHCSLFTAHCILAFLLVLFSCSREAGREFVFNEGEAFGTIYHLTYESPQGEDFQEEIRGLMEGFSRSLSIYDPESIISGGQSQRSGGRHGRILPDVFPGGSEDLERNRWRLRHHRGSAGECLGIRI